MNSLALPRPRAGRAKFLVGILLGAGAAVALAEAARDPNRARLAIHYNGPKPDLMRAEAQAILEGKLQPDGTFHADNLLLECPTRYEESGAQS